MRAKQPAVFMPQVMADSWPEWPLRTFITICGIRPPRLMMPMVDACKSAPAAWLSVHPLCTQQDASLESHPIGMQQTSQACMLPDNQFVACNFGGSGQGSELQQLSE